jgi:small-conductance mechanosensitive channel
MTNDPNNILELTKPDDASNAGGPQEQNCLEDVNMLPPGRGLAKTSLFTFLAGLLAFFLAFASIILSLATAPSGGWLMSVNEIWATVGGLLAVAGVVCWLISLVCGLIVVRCRPKVIWWLAVMLMLVGGFVFLLLNP